MRAWIATLAGLAGLASSCSSSSPAERSAPVAPAGPNAKPAAPSAKPASPSAKTAEPNKAGHSPGAEDAANIVTAEVVKMNSAEYGRPAAAFRTGSVSQIEGPRARKTPTGFEVRFASHATITTPTVYEHKVLVSGGF